MATHRLSAFIAGIGAALALTGYMVASAALDVLDLVLFTPLRWLFHPEAAIELELRALRHEARESIRLERDKPMRAFMAREREHAEFYGGRGFMPDYAL